MGQKAALGEIEAGLLPLADYVRLQDTFERLGRFGIAVHGRAHSVVLFSARPVRQLDGATIAVTEDTSTSVVLLRLLLEKRYGVIPASYDSRRRAEKRSTVKSVARDRRTAAEADALLLIGDEALRFKQANTQYPYEIDLAFEWWLWQHQPSVFAVWTVRKDIEAPKKKELEAALARALAVNTGRLEAIAQEAAAGLGVPAEQLVAYLAGFHYRFGKDEEDGMARFEALMHEHHLL